jgi:hypothetical protein
MERSWKQTPTGKIIAYGAPAYVSTALDQGDVRLAVSLQAKSSGTFKAKRRQEKLRSQRKTKHDRHCFSARTFWTLIYRMMREAKTLDKNGEIR